MDLEALPGGDLIETGLADLARGLESVAALLVCVGGPRLRRLGMRVPELPDPEHRLYRALAAEDPDSAHARYNALVRRLVSFERARGGLRGALTERLQAVLFDAAGTLIELREPVGESYARIARGYGARVPASRLDEAFRRILAAAPPMAFPGEGPAGVAARERAWWRDVVRATFRAADGAARFTDFEACFEALWRHFASPEAWRLVAGADAALAALAGAGLRLGVVSNFDQRLHGILLALGIRERFELLVLPADAGAAKPEARIFEVALDRLGLPAAAALYVGDDVDHDVAAARAAGLRAVRMAGPATLAGLPALVGVAAQRA